MMMFCFPVVTKQGRSDVSSFIDDTLKVAPRIALLARSSLSIDDVSWRIDQGHGESKDGKTARSPSHFRGDGLNHDQSRQ